MTEYAAQDGADNRATDIRLCARPRHLFALNPAMLGRRADHGTDRADGYRVSALIRTPPIGVIRLRQRLRRFAAAALSGAGRAY
ncbi:hypothetical protein GCM10028811_06390 [Uliginosibacterium sediminicola]